MSQARMMHDCHAYLFGSRPRRIGACVAIALGCVGCSSSRLPGEGAERPKSRDIALSEFVGEPSAIVPSVDNPKVAAALAGEDRAEAERRARNDIPGVLDITDAVNEPPVLTPAEAAGKPVIVESKVGQINGRPVLASQILEPLDGRLRALTLQAKTPEAWRREATSLIFYQLVSRVRDELVLAEAQSNLTTEQRQGLFYFLNQLQKNLVSTQGGSSVQADEALREQTGRGLAQEAQDRLDRELIENELNTKVRPRVNISWRQVKNEYERNFDERYAARSRTRLRIIEVLESDEEAVERITESIDAGRFAEAASTPANRFRPADGGAIELELENERSYENTPLQSNPQLGPIARSLSSGETSIPIRYLGTVYWVHSEGPVEVAERPLYDAQLEVEQSLRQRRTRQETDRYFVRLFERGSFSDLEAMRDMLVNIAADRYMPQAKQQ